MSNKKDLDIFVENIYRLKYKLFKTEVYIALDYDTHVPDLMTRMRALPGFAVVGQTEKVDRLQGGGARIGLSIKYLPESSDLYANLDEMSKAIKQLPGVKTIKVISYNKRPILKNGKPILY
tara:strand:+ start:3860 stop:4222 length:363 start_codon:yes stop_codon:yes gene_type:complete